MSLKKKIRIGGVPEHFNLPWHLAIENNLFESKGIDLEWVTFKGGTGAMCQALRNDEVDMCVILTEGVIRDMINGNPSKIVSKYINTPLIWGVHTAAENELSYYGNTFSKKYAISRKGSGSHLMPHVDAMLKEKELNSEQFHVIGNLENALESLKKKETDVFYWEKYTTKPYVDSGELRTLGEFVTPWPCFVLAATDKILEECPQEISDVLNVIQFACSQFVKMPNVIELLSSRYKQKYEDIENWFWSTEWASDSEVEPKMVDNVIFSLKKAGLIEQNEKVNLDELVAQL